MGKSVRKRLTDIESYELIGAIKDVISTPSEIERTVDDIYEAICVQLEFVPPKNAVRSRLDSLGFRPAKKTQKSHAKMLGEVTGHALLLLAKGTTCEDAIRPVAEDLIEGDIEAAYAGRGPLVI